MDEVIELKISKDDAKVLMQALVESRNGHKNRIRNCELYGATECIEGHKTYISQCELLEKIIAEAGTNECLL